MPKMVFNAAAENCWPLDCDCFGMAVMPVLRSCVDNLLRCSGFNACDPGVLARWAELTQARLCGLMEQSGERREIV